MSKVSVPVTNDYCPQTLFLYGTYREDGSPNFGLFCWFSYCVIENRLGVMACIGESKLTRDLILKNRVFSANLVTEDILPLADYFGCTQSYTTPDKMNIPFEWEKGQALNVPVLCQSPVCYELEVAHELVQGDAVVLLCNIRNVLHDEALENPMQSLEQKLARIVPVCTTQTAYLNWQGNTLAKWGDLAGQIKK